MASDKIRSIYKDKLFVYFSLFFVLVLVTYTLLMSQHRFLQFRVIYLQEITNNQHNLITLSFSIKTGIEEIQSIVHRSAHLKNKDQINTLFKELNDKVLNIENNIQIVKDGGSAIETYPVNYGGVSYKSIKIDYENIFHEKYNTEAMTLQSKILDLKAYFREYKTLLTQNIVEKNEYTANSIINHEKKMDAFFFRFHENANRLLFDSYEKSEQFKEKTQQIINKYRKIKKSVTVITVLVFLIVGLLIMRKLIQTLVTRFSSEQKLNESNERLEHLVAHRTKELKKRMVYFENLFMNTPVAVLIVDEKFNAVSINRKFTDMFGYTLQDLIKTPHYKLILPDDKKHEAKQTLENIKNKQTYTFESERITKSGERIHVSLTVSPVVVQNNVEGHYLLFTDITDKKLFEEKLEYQAFHDGLTNLYNRRLFIDRLCHSIIRHHRDENYSFSVGLLDLDDFKKINDVYGHTAGDQVLVTVANRLKNTLRTVDTIARLGGDEFAVILEGNNLKEIDDIERRIHKNLSEPVTIDGVEHGVNISLGIITSDFIKTTDPLDVLRFADIAMYHSKKTGKGSTTLFNENLHEEVMSRYNIEQEIRNAIKNDEFVAFYQPMYSLEDDTLVGAEALARWIHPEKGLLYPGYFIDIAEKSGLIEDLGYKMLESSIRDFASIEKKNFKFVSVNISAKQLQDLTFIDTVKKLLEKYKMLPSSLILEVTESYLMDDPKGAVQILGKLKELGIRIAIDDFGTGYSSLSYLNMLPVTILKIDRSFINDAFSKNSSRRILDMIVSLGQTMDMEIIAEGIETEEQSELVKSLGCTYLQGYLRSKPVPLAELKKHL